MMKSLAKAAVPRQVLSECKKLGEDIRHARIRRKFTMDELSERTGISRGTLSKIENGNPNVALGIIGRVLFILGIKKGIGQLADLSVDPISRDLEIELLPKRVKKK
ncbi:MAG: helix-turn-helix transcriptional regulator [Mariprofundaceae bacterium]